jgi:catechol 2,3-dioxygenase-like lactoylglutathione lyase family enzyme
MPGNPPTEDNMSSTDVTAGASTESPEVGTIDMKLEVIAIPVSDVDRSKSFYESLGWRLDADFDLGEGMRVVQFTPPHSECSIAFGKGFIKGEPGSVERLEMVVSDIEAAREFLISRGVEVSDFFHRGESGFEPGLDPQRTSYNSYATFSDPDGNGFLLQEITERLPGRVWEG